MPRSVFLPLGTHELHVTEWGDVSNPAFVMWHGLARNGRDFDELARAFASEYFVICPDTIGRGLSSWAVDPDREYTLPNYARLAGAMLDHYGKNDAIWLGTSMGGQIGMTLAAATDRVSALIINDIGPMVPDAALDRIVTYSSELPVFSRVSEAEAWLREVYTPFGPADDPFWARMAEASVRRCADGQLTLHYDPRIIDVLNADRESTDLWDIYDSLQVSTHVLRGRSSDLLTEDIASEMLTRGPRPEITVFDEAGHAPSLTRASDAALISNIVSQLAG
ncbi:alpha/beta fold hydrolase [Maritimibacter dapengensis]|nr:alpha/beta hydrolase [Maritimibacter dapengensis]